MDAVLRDEAALVARLRTKAEADADAEAAATASPRDGKGWWLQGKTDETRLAEAFWGRGGGENGRVRTFRSEIVAILQAAL
jgi:hypothetical protein